MKIERKGSAMLFNIAAIFIPLLLLGLVTSYTTSGFIHVLLAVTIVVALIRIFQGGNLLGKVV
jgi:hypothetical protein